MENINREDMLELTRRMNLSRNCFSRIAGAYLDEEGLIDGTFHIHFLKLSPPEQSKFISIAKEIVFAGTNVNLQEYTFSQKSKSTGGIWQLLMALKECELKNDALLDVLYEMFGEHYKAEGSYAVYFFYGTYDVPVRAGDKESMWESEESYRFLIAAVCPLVGEYEPGRPEYGFLFPAFKDRSSDALRINVFHARERHAEMEKMLGLEQTAGSHA